MIQRRTVKTIRIAVLLAALCVGGFQTVYAAAPHVKAVEQERRGAKLLATFDSGIARFAEVAFSPDGKRIIVSDHYGASMTWDIARKKRVAFHAAPKNRPEPAFFALPSPTVSPDNAFRVTVPSDKRIVLTNRATGRRRVVSLPDGKVQAVAFTPDSRLLLASAYAPSGDEQGAQQNTVRIMRVKDGRLMRVLKGGAYRLEDIVFSGRGLLMATRHSHQVSGAEPAHGEDVIKIWDTRTWQPRCEYPTRDDVMHMQFAGDNHTLLVLCSHWTRSSYNLIKFDPDCRQAGTLPVGILSIYEVGEVSHLADVKLSQDGTLLVSAKEGHAKCQNVTTGQSLALYDRGDPMQSANPDSIALSSDNRFVADADEHGIVTLWQMPPASAWRKAAGK